MEILASKTAEVGGATVRRALPQRTRRTVGAWCFVDHFGPTSPAQPAGMQIGAHPHIGLHTVTWLLDGQLVHRDSLGSDQPIRAGQLNLMTAGHGIAHAEEAPVAGTGTLHGAQLWVAQPDGTRHGPPGFEHHASLPHADLGAVRATVLIGELAGAVSPARADSPIVGAELRVGGGAAVPLRPEFEYGVVVLDGEIDLDGTRVAPGVFAALGDGRDELHVAGTATALLLGGEPFDEHPLMWWNFVGRTWDEIASARTSWEDRDEGRFAPVDSRLPIVPAPALPPMTARRHDRTNDRTTDHGGAHDG